MENRQSLIDSFWQELREKPRMEVNHLLSQMGMAKSMYAKLNDEDSRKLVLGLVTRLDDAALQAIVPLARS